jgi:hypothetical protein
METNEIIESGFVKAFIAEYFEYKIHSFYPDKDRLLYVLCSTDLEKQQVTAKQIEVTKSEIQKLGNEDLSFAYLLSCKPESISGHNYIEPSQRFDFWLNNFSEHFIYSINTFTPIIEACNLLENKISNENFENEFWEMYPASQKPKDNCLPFVIQRESELLNEIEYSISEYNENEYWEFDFEEYQKFIDTSNPLELLFNISELLVQLNRLEMFNEFLLPPQQTETKTDKLKAPVLGLFCSLINKIGIDKKDETESATVYCERICGKFKLPYTDRVRQNYNVNETNKLIQELTEKVLPLIDNETKLLVEKYFDSKHPPKQNLYG